MFTPPASPRAKLDQPNPMENIQHQAAHALFSAPQPSGSSLDLSEKHSTSTHIQFSSSPSPSPKARAYLKPTLTHQFDLQIPLSPSPASSSSNSESKRRIGRRIKWTAIAIPLVLLLVALGHRCTPLGMAGWINDESNFERVNASGSLFDEMQSQSHAHHSHSYSRHAHAIPSPSIPLPSDDPQLVRRQTSSSGSATSSPTISVLETPTSAASSASGSPSPSASTTIPVTAQAIPTVPTSTPVLPTPFPQPWDDNFAQNFSSQSCFNFFLNMTNDLDFRSCRPFGMLENTSGAFATIQKNLSALNAVLWGSCNPPPGLDQCTTTMSTFASSLQSACPTDLAASNLYATTTLQALHAYPLTYSTGCLIDPATSSYCYLRATQNPNPSDLYFYELVNGVELSNTTTPTCSGCVKAVMGLYVAALDDPGTGGSGQLAEADSKRSGARAFRRSQAMMVG